jgi:hypothetical protein
VLRHGHQAVVLSQSIVVGWGGTRDDAGEGGGRFGSRDFEPRPTHIHKRQVSSALACPVTRIFEDQMDVARGGR